MDYKNGGLLFKSKKDYKELSIVDDNIFNILKIVKNTNTNLDDVFNNIISICIKELYKDACKEVYSLFPNTSTLLIMNIKNQNSIEYKVACKFFCRINIKSYKEE